jgi:hypothetical protein
VHLGGEPGDASQPKAPRTPAGPGAAVAVRRLVINITQSAEWKALISMYITTIPFSCGACCAAEHIRRTDIKSAGKQRHHRKGWAGRET